MPLTRRTFLTAAAAAVESQGRPEPLRRRPNLILYMADELRAESIACYGHPLVKTPNIDRLASQGVRFEQCHAQNPVCGPSRCSFATGWPVHVRGHRSLYYFLRPDEPNLFRYLRGAGYDVYWFGKNDMLAADSFPSSVTRAESKRPSGPVMGGANPYPQDDPHFYSFLREKIADRRNTGDYANVRAAVEILRRPADRPFCIFLPLLYPHPPYAAPEDFHNMYRPADLPPLRPVGLPRQPRFHVELRRKMRLDHLHEADFREVQAVHLGMVSYTDWLLGELMEAVEATNHASDTALFFLADHGDFAGDYGLVEKWPNGMKDPLTRVPLVARVPGFQRGRVSPEIVELYDVMATCLELAGIEARHTHFARSLTPQLEGQPGDPRRAAFSEGGYNTNEPQCFEPLGPYGNPANPYYPKVALQNEQPSTVTRTSMVRTLEHKLIYRPDGQSEFYDLRADPRELHNVYGDAAHSGPQGELFRRLMDWYVRTSDVAPLEHDSRNLPEARSS
jgi:arylsulfatase A-like enzyme